MRDWREATRLYPELERVRTAPELAERLKALHRQAGGSYSASPTLSRSADLADLDAVGAGRLIPRQGLIDSFLLACGVRPEHFEPWHLALTRVSATTGAVIELRSRAIELAHALGQEARKDRRRHPWAAVLSEARAERRDPGGINRASTRGRLRALAESILEELQKIWKHMDERNLHSAVYWAKEVCEQLREDDGYADGDAVGLVRELAAIQVDASGVDLTDLNIAEVDAAIGVIWTAETKWPRIHSGL